MKEKVGVEVCLEGNPAIQTFITAHNPLTIPHPHPIHLILPALFIYVQFLGNMFSNKIQDACKDTNRTSEKS